jgi:hypothetical protein
MAKLSVLIISMIVFGMILVGGFGSLMASLAINYNLVDYNETKLDAYNKINELTTQVTNIENKTTGLQGSQAGVTDILGGFFESGYNAMILSYSSLSIFEDLASSAREDIPALNRIEIFYTGTMAIVLVLVVFLILGAVIKWII